MRRGFIIFAFASNQSLMLSPLPISFARLVSKHRKQSYILNTRPITGQHSSRTPMAFASK